MDIEEHKTHLCVCICTYKRPELLKKLLFKLESQETNGYFSYSVVIVDNDSSESARHTVEFYDQQLKFQIKYFVEKEQNISIARNRAIEEAQGNFIALIDDDEYPSRTWLLTLFKAFIQYRPSGGILGPVIPFYPKNTPLWLIKSRICERPNHPTGTKLDWNMTRTGNVFMLHKIFSNNHFAFDKKIGRSGGEDKKIFKELIENGFSFVWCSDAIVYETVLPERWKLSFYLRRSLLLGAYTIEEKGRNLYRSFLKSLISLYVYSALLIASLFIGKHYLFKTLIRVVYDFARVMGCIGIVFVKERSEQE